MHLIPVRLVLHALAIPLRKPFRHGASERGVAEPLILEVQLANGETGYGEAQPRPYVTGERVERVGHSIQTVLLPALAQMRPTSYFDAIEQIAALPECDAAGRPIGAARAAVEIALLDAYSRASNKSLEALAGWLGDAGLVGGATSDNPRLRGRALSSSAEELPPYSGVLSADSPAAIRGSVWKMRLFGLRDFKLKVSDDSDDDRIGAAVASLGRKLRRGGNTLRLDANGSWSVRQALDRLERWRDLPITCVEQPVAGPAKLELDSGEADWPQLVRRSDELMREVAKSSPLPIMADESLLCLADAARLASLSPRIWFNIRIGKNGGLLPALRMAATARAAGIPLQLGCMVGETSVLAAAGHWFLRMVKGTRFAEGAYGRFLLRGDVCERPVQFRWRGRLPPLRGPGLGTRVSPDLLRKHAAAPALTMGLA